MGGGNDSPVWTAVIARRGHPIRIDPKTPGSVAMATFLTRFGQTQPVSPALVATLRLPCWHGVGEHEKAVPAIPVTLKSAK